MRVFIISIKRTSHLNAEVSRIFMQNFTYGTAQSKFDIRTHAAYPPCMSFMD